MKIAVRYFAHLREVVGREGETVRWDENPPTLASFLEFLNRRHGGLDGSSKGGFLCSVNREFADGETVLAEGDEVGLFPPVSGG